MEKPLTFHLTLINEEGIIKDSLDNEIFWNDVESKEPDLIKKVVEFKESLDIDISISELLKQNK